MRIARTWYFALTCCLSFAACAKTSGGQTGDEDAIPGNEFYAALAKQQTSGNYKPATDVVDLFGRSEEVAVGRAVALKPGRKFQLENSTAGDLIETAVLEVAVEQDLRDTKRKSLYLELIVGDAEADASGRVPNDKILVFATRAPAVPFLNATITHAGDGMPAGETLFELTTPQGLVLALDDGSFSQPFEPNDTALGRGTFADLIAEIEDGGQVRPGGMEDASLPGPDGSTEDAGSAAGPDGSTATCPGEGATQCSAECFAVTATPLDVARSCFDYNAQIVIGCNDGVGPPIVVCIERISDGQTFQLGGGNPYPMSTVYRSCPAFATDIPSCP